MNRRNRENQPRASQRPNVAAEPPGPTHIEERSWLYIFKRTANEFIDDQCIDGAAALTHFAVLSLFPGLVAIFSLLGLIGQNDDAAAAIMGIISEVLPAEAAESLRGPLAELAKAPGVGFTLVTSIIVSLWSASGYVGALSRVMNRIYEVEEGRPFWKRRPMQILVTVVLVLSGVFVGLVLVISGDLVSVVGRAINASAAVQTAWQISKWPLLVVVIVSLIALLYYAAPNAQQPKFRWMSPGAVIAITVLAVASAGFGIYVANFSNYGRVYGPLAGIVVFLLWLWIANLALLLGAEFDAELQRGRQLQAGIAAEHELRTAPRDTKQIRKRKRRRRKLEAEGREIRAEQR